MIILVKLFGILITLLGLTIFASPEFTKKLFAFFTEGRRIYYAGVVRTVVGLIILISASRCSIPLAAIALGLMFLVSGIAVFAADLEKLKSFITAYSGMSGLIIRLMGLVAAFFGILIFSIF